MKGMPLPFDFEGKGFLDLDLDLIVKNSSAISIASCFAQKNCCFGEPNSVLDSAKIPSRPASSSTLSSSLGGGGGGSTGGGGGGGAASTDTAGVAAVSDTNNPSPGWPQESATATSSVAGGGDFPPSVEIGATVAEKFAMEDWESVLSESLAASPTQEQSILRWIMGDVEDSSMGNLNKVLQIGAAGAGGGGSAASEFDLGAGFGAVDQLGFGGDQFGGNFANPSFPHCNRSSSNASNLNPNFKFPPNSLHPSNLGSIPVNQTSFDSSSAETKPPFFNPQLMMNQHQFHLAPSPSLFFEHNLLYSPPAKRHNSGEPQIFLGRQQQQQLHLQQQPIPHYLPQRPKVDELGQIQGHQPQHQQQAIIDQLYKAAELLHAGNPVLAQGILARLNHQLSPIVKPFNRAAFYCKEALQLLLHNNLNLNPSMANSSPISLIFKIGAYKSFSEVSPLVQFANFTCNQALLEVLDGFDRIHIVDFDIGYGGQWASLMQELAVRSGGAPAVKITALAAPGMHDQLELSLTRENLVQFACEINVPFQFEVMSIDLLNSGSWTLPFHVLDSEGVAVNLPISCLANHQLSVPLVLSFIKQLSPRIVVSVDRGCDRTDLPFANHIINTLQSYSSLLESLDAGNVNTDAMQKIERLLLQPAIEKIVLGRFRCPEKTQHWRALFLSAGFSPLTFSNFAESQAECVIKRTPVRGYQVEKRQSSLVLCWQRKELISASAWGC